MNKKLQIFSEYLGKNNLKHTAQRDFILQEFFEVKGHISPEELYLKVKDKNPKIGFSTVYRTLKLIAKCGLAEEQHFADGITRFEHHLDRGHHDHLICKRCGRTIEFFDRRIEDIQKQISDKNDFTIEDHKLEIYGICRKCVKG